VSLERDESIDLNMARVVRLAGRDVYVAPLSLRDILAVADELPKVKDVTAENVTGERLAPLGEIVWHGLRRAYPKLTRDEFLDLPITLAELIAAFPVVMQQAGGRKPETVMGEAEPHRDGAMGIPTDSTKSTGAASSPTS
jgi:hypothetical protein